MMEKLDCMCAMQDALDNDIIRSKNWKYDKDKVYLALLDEIGELNHELKKDWCWWKDTCKPINKYAVLEELVDVWHFALSIFNHQDGPKCLDWEIRSYNGMKKQPREYKRLFQIILSDYHKFIIGLMLELTLSLGFTFDEVYDEYIRKNKVNYERLENGY